MLAAPEPERPRIGIVDDDPMIRALIVEVLADEGFETLVWDGTSDPATFLGQQRPDLLILDLRIGSPRTSEPTLDGVRQLRAAAGGAPTILCSADLPFFSAHADELAAEGFMILEKPFDLDSLIACVQTLAGRRESLELVGQDDGNGNELAVS